MKVYFITDSVGHNIFGIYPNIELAISIAESKLDIEDEYHIHLQNMGDFQSLGFYFDRMTLVKKVTR